MPRKLSPEEAAVMIIRRRLQQMEEDKMAQREQAAKEAESGEQTEDRPGRSGKPEGS